MDVFCGWIINIGVLKISETPNFDVKLSFEVSLAETTASRGGVIPQQKAQNPKIAHFQGRRLIFACRDIFGQDEII